MIASLVFLLAYIQGTPLLYGEGSTVPMAITTAFAFVMLGIAMVAAAGDEAFHSDLLPVLPPAPSCYGLSSRWRPRLL